MCQLMLRKEGPAGQGVRPNRGWTFCFATMTTGDGSTSNNLAGQATLAHSASSTRLRLLTPFLGTPNPFTHIKVTKYPQRNHPHGLSTQRGTSV